MVHTGVLFGGCSHFGVTRQRRNRPHLPGAPRHHQPHRRQGENRIAENAGGTRSARDRCGALAGEKLTLSFYQ
jgi:hypothetical protein